MAQSLGDIVLALFVPADRPERIVKAAAAGADAVCIDLEDAVAAASKEAARSGLVAANLPDDIPLLLRINAVGTQWHADDLEAAKHLPLAAIVLPKAESGEDVARVAAACGKPVLALIETARGLAAAEDVAKASERLLFGSIDFAADLAIAHERQSLLYARSLLVLASRLAGRPAPMDGVTIAIQDETEVESDSLHAVSMGFGGKLLIHPAQIAPARRGFAPTRNEIDWANRIIDASASAGTGAALRVDGMMVDAPVVARARQILRRAQGKR